MVNFFLLPAQYSLLSFMQNFLSSLILNVYKFLYFLLTFGSAFRLFFFLFFLKFIVLNSYYINVKFFFLFVLFNFLNVFFSKFDYNDVLVFHLFYLTNLDLFLFLNVFFVLTYAYLSLFSGKLIPDFSQGKFEFLYNFIAQTGFSHISWKGQRHFVFFIALFLFILVSNFIGMVPFSFTVTSHIFQTFSLGCGVILSITILAISTNGLSWFKLFFPNLPMAILPLFTCIEIVSYISRAFSLAIRLFANLMSGHTLLNILTSFILKIGSKGFFSFLIALIPFLLISAIILLEMVIAVLQAYVFVTLATIYLKDAYSTGH